MSSKQEKALNLIKKFSPSKFGIKSAYYRVGDGKIEFRFIVEKKNASRLISYLNSLSSIIENEVKGLDIECSVYINDSKKNVETVVKEEKMKKMPLFANIEYAGVCGA